MSKKDDLDGMHYDMSYDGDMHENVLRVDDLEDLVQWDCAGDRMVHPASAVSACQCGPAGAVPTSVPRRLASSCNT
eukprot:gene6529-6283_t